MRPSRFRARDTGSPIPPEDLEDPMKVAEGYAKWVERSGYSPETRRAYTHRARTFCTWVAEHPHHGGDVFLDEHARNFAVRDFRDHLLALERSPAGVDAAVGAALRLTVWAGLEAPDSRMFPATAASATVVPQHLEDEQVRYVMRLAEARGPRDLALFSIGIYSGLRIGEMHRLNVDDVHLQRDGGTMKVHGKGNRWRTIPVHALIRKPLDGWLRERRFAPGAAEERAMLIARDGGRLSARSIFDVVKAVGAEAELPDLHPHVLRHTCGRAMVKAGVPMRDIQEYLGHRSLSSTMIYTAPTVGELTEATSRWGVTW